MFYSWHNFKQYIDSKNMENKHAKERPLECSSCTRKVTVKYSEVKEVVKNCLYMCSDCPVLDKYLFHEETMDYSNSSNLACGHCNTTLLDLQRGEMLGCSDCYQTFENFINQELNEFAPSSEVEVSHKGHKPGEIKEINPSLKILALNEALTKTLNEENYEQAAWLRDQIKDLKIKADDE